MDDIKDNLSGIAVGVSILPLGAVTPEMVATVQECNRKMADLLDLRRSVKVTTRKPTAADIALHQAKMRISGVCQGIEPFSRGYLRRSPRTE